MAGSSREITFIVSGKDQTTDGREDAPRGTSLRSAVRVGTRRGASDLVRIKAKVDEDVVRLHIANGPTLYLHPEDARELLRAQMGAAADTARGASTERGADPDSNEVVVPTQLGWRGLESRPDAPGTRGRPADWTGGVVLDGIDVLTGLVKDKAATLVLAGVTRKFDGHVEAGVYRLAPDALQPLKGSGRKLDSIAKSDDPSLVLVHGTFSDTPGTFGKLWQSHPDRVQELFKHYEGRVYGLDHETLGVSPFGNALTLVKALPKGTRLHLVTHSRGGLVAEALARVCAGLGASKADLDCFAGAKYAQHRKDLVALADAVQAQKITVERIVRVACPARGTLLASRRLDAYLSVFKWGLEAAGVPVLPELVDFLAEVARRRADPDELPGLEAMMPKRPFTDWLNAPGDPIAGDLRVVAGDMQGDTVMSWIKTLLSDAFYWTDNDLVVQTRSMYGGTPRAEGGATFVLDRGGKVNHFSYFSNDRTASLITRGLIDDRPEFFSSIGPLSWAGEDASGTRAALAAARSRGANVADRPVVFVLPGILGSHLKVDGKRVWLSVRFINNLDRLRWDPKTDARVTPDGPVGMSYDNLIDYLAETHEVVPFSYDWRRPIEEEARRLADEVDKALAAREKTQQPVRIVAHSLGGLVARTMKLERPATWKRFLSRPGARFLMLGTPNSGSFAPMQVMSGDDTFGSLFAMVGSLFDGHEARQIVAQMPGLVQLQAGLVNGKRDLGKTKSWEDLEKADIEEVEHRISLGSFWHKLDLQKDALRWGIPPQATLDMGVALRKRLDKQAEEFASDVSGMALVVGNAKSTPADIDIVDGDVVYLNTTVGDGRVTLTNAMLKGVKTWQVDVAHGDLADAKKAFDAYVELLTTGDTAKLPVVNAVNTSRGAAGAEPDGPALLPSRPARGMRADTPPSTMNDVFSSQAERAQPDRASGTRLSVRVTNGNLKFVHDPLVVGHYYSLKLTGAEAAIDRLIGAAMSQSLTARLYPADIGSNQIFTNRYQNPDNPFAMPRPQAVIVVGLGDEGELRASELVETVRQGVIAFAQRVAEQTAGAPATFNLASTLIGSGGINQNVGASAQAIAQGVRQANILLANIEWPVVARLELIELYLDRAAEALNALRSMGDSDGRGIVVEPFIVRGPGGLLRPSEFGYRGADYDLISVQQRRSRDSTDLEYVLSTRRARDEVRGAIAQSRLVGDLVKAGADDANDDLRIGRTLFKLLVPIELESFLAGSTELRLLLDKDTAAYPWEMLDVTRGDGDGSAEGPPWGIRTRLLRKLRTDDFREAPRSALAGGVLVIGEPQCPPEIYPPLPGASAEATEVAKVLGADPLLKGNAMSIANAVFDRSYAILHVAGHGDFVNGVGGVVLSSGTTFGPREIKAMRIVPDLAFINCCHLGSFANDPNKRAPRLRNGRPAFAANVAEELIKIGVRCVIAAGWAVDDDAAMLFARTFYTHLTRGRRFVDAVGEARSQTYAQFPRSNTWAAYQCYGDPDWTYRQLGGEGSGSRARMLVASDQGLILRLANLRAGHAYDNAKDEDVREELQYLLGVCNPDWLKLGEVAAAFGEVYGEIGEFKEAITWYERAVAAEDGRAGLFALEHLGNMRARHGENVGDAQEVRAGIAQIERAVAIATNVEREAILGSAYKRLSDVLQASADVRAALEEALDHYQKSEKIARDRDPQALFYPALNCMNIELRLQFLSRAVPRPFDRERVKLVRQSLEVKNRDSADFWSVVGVTELGLYEVLAERRLADMVDAAIKDLQDLVRRATSTKQWDSFSYQLRKTLGAYLLTPGLSAAERAAAGKLGDALPKGEKYEPGASNAKQKPGRSPKRRAKPK